LGEEVFSFSMEAISLKLSDIVTSIYKHKLSLSRLEILFIAALINITSKVLVDSEP
jgi:hypothetical protein